MHGLRSTIILFISLILALAYYRSVFVRAPLARLSEEQDIWFAMNEHQTQMMREHKDSSLRFDWHNLPPMTPLGKIFQSVQSKCIDFDKIKSTPQIVMPFSLLLSGMGSTLHTWSQALCHATEHNMVLMTKPNPPFAWNDQKNCPKLIEKTIQNANIKDRTNSPSVPSNSPFWCYFGHHESGLNCPVGSLDFNNVHLKPAKVRWYESFRCDHLEEQYGLSGIRAGAMEWLFQNVSQFILDEAERQIRHDAFPDAPTAISESNPTLTYTVLPPAESLITVHIRWGDKAKDMELIDVETYIKATQSLMSPQERRGEKTVHIYIATEDPEAVEKYRQKSPKSWQIHASGPKNPKNNNHMVDASRRTQGRAGMESLAALLIALESNRYVLTTRSNWSRLINELRKNVVDPRCGNCTRWVDVRYGET